MLRSLMDGNMISEARPLVSTVHALARNLKLAIFASLVGAVLAFPSLALAQERTPLTVDQPADGGTLFGNSGGNFRYYVVDYPGNNVLVVITLDVSDSYQELGDLVGFNVYTPDGSEIRGEPAGGDPNALRARASFSREAPGEFLIQLYSYVDGKASHYTVTASGLDSDGPTLTGSESPTTAPLIQGGNSFVAGSLTGSSGGAIRFYNVDYAGNGADLKATLSFAPRSSLSDDAIGLQLYDGDTLLATSRQVDQTANTAIDRLTYQGPTAATLGLQVFNYATGHRIDFTVEISGLGAAPVEIEGNTRPETAYSLTVDTSSVVGTVPGSRAGGFVFFNLLHPGRGQRITVSVTTDADSRVLSTDVGINIYQGASLVQQGLASRDKSGRLGASVSVAPTTATSYGIQVYNYSGGIPLRYRVTVTGF